MVNWQPSVRHLHVQECPLAMLLLQCQCMGPLLLPVTSLLQMHKGLDIVISDEASSTVIHVKGPVNARMCDVGCVFDKLGESPAAVLPATLGWC